MTSLNAEMTTASPTSAVVPQQARESDVGTARLYPVDRRRQHGVRVEQRRRKDLAKTRSAVVIISSLFFTVTVVSTFAVAVFCRRRNTVFVLQKCEQTDYAAASVAAEDELSTDCESPTVVTYQRVDRMTSQRSRDPNRCCAVAPGTRDLSLFCVSRNGQKARTVRGPFGAPRRVVSDVRTSWLELRPATTLPVECTGDDVKYRVRRDIISAGSLPECDVSGLSADDNWRRIQRSTSLDAHVCRFALTRDAASSHPSMSRSDDTATFDERSKAETLSAELISD